MSYVRNESTIVHFPNLDLLSDTQRNGQLEAFSLPSLPQHEHWDFTLLAIGGPSNGEGMPGIDQDRFLYATPADFI